MKLIFLVIGECMVEMVFMVDGIYLMGFVGDMLNIVWYVCKILLLDWDVSYFIVVGDDKVLW